MLAIIPARGGSKGLPGKNIKELCGKPLIQYTVEAAKNAAGIDRVIVTTDDKAIADSAAAAGAEIPFMRPDELASDTASAVDVYIHAVEYMMEQTGEEIDKFMVLLPTAPLRDSDDIDAAINQFNEQGASTLVSVKEAETPPTWYFAMDENERIANAGFGSTQVVANRQISNTYYVPNGAIYILDYKLLKEKRTYYCENTTAYVMSARKSVDIDNAFDFEMAEYMMKNN